jgi:hypothetical protein
MRESAIQLRQITGRTLKQLGIRDRALKVGTHAWPYFSGSKILSDLETDANFLGGIRQPDGVLLCFNDGTSLMWMKANGRTREEIDSDARSLSARLAAGDPDVVAMFKVFETGCAGREC